MLQTKAIFARKENAFEPKDCIIEKVIELDSYQFSTFKNNMLRDYNFIAENIDLMRVENDGTHCLLILGDGENDGILVDSSGSKFARYAAFLPNARNFINAQTPEQSAEKTKRTTLGDLLSCKWEDIHLCHIDIENDPATIVELSNETLTVEGKAALADVLNANVGRIYTGDYGLQLEITGVKSSRLDAFSSMLAGYCSVENYDKWVVRDGQAYSDLALSDDITVEDFVNHHRGNHIEIMSPGGFVNIGPNADLEKLSAHAGVSGTEMGVSWDELKDQIIKPEHCNFNVKENKWYVLSEHPSQDMTMTM